MECLSKFWINRDSDAPKLVPCQKCFACKMNKRGDWVTRLNEQVKKSSGNYFATLTYSEENVPFGFDGMTLNRADVPAAIKRLRKLMYGNKKGSLKYYAVGEYGTKTKRPHYHVLFIDTNLDKYIFRKLLERAWSNVENGNNQFKSSVNGKGHVHVGEVKIGSIKYVAGYIINDFYKEDNPFMQRPFANMSKGLGLAYLTEAKINWHKDDLENRCYIPSESGRKTKMPLYLKKKIYDESEIQVINENYQWLLSEKNKHISLSEHQKKFDEQREIQRVRYQNYLIKNKKAQI